MQYFALTIIGRDRPGIVAQVTEILFRLGFNIADSSCSILGGMILIISNPNITSKDQFEEDFRHLEETNLSVFIRTMKPGGEISPDLEGEQCMISVYGADKPGIVYQVAKVLGEHQINITDLNTKLIGTTEKPVYVMMIEAILPPDIEIDAVENWMTALKKQLQVDISVRSLIAVEL